MYEFDFTPWGARIAEARSGCTSLTCDSVCTPSAPKFTIYGSQVAATPRAEAPIRCQRFRDEQVPPDIVVLYFIWHPWFMVVWDIVAKQWHCAGLGAEAVREMRQGMAVALTAMIYEKSDIYAWLGEGLAGNFHGWGFKVIRNLSSEERDLLDRCLHGTPKMRRRSAKNDDWSQRAERKAALNVAVVDATIDFEESIKDLPLPQQQAARMKFTGYSLNQIAAQLGMTLEKVRWLLHKCPGSVQRFFPRDP